MPQQQILNAEGAPDLWNMPFSTEFDLTMNLCLNESYLNTCGNSKILIHEVIRNHVQAYFRLKLCRYSRTYFFKNIFMRIVVTG